MAPRSVGGIAVAEDVLLAIDQGTSSSRAIGFSAGGEMLALEQQSFEQIYPAAGWVEHDAEVIWATVLSTGRRALQRLTEQAFSVAALGITNQRETTVLWDRRSGAPIYNAIVWQDRRTAARCAELQRSSPAAQDELRRKTGLLFDPYFSATKIAWILDRVPGAREDAKAGRIAFGTVDSYLLWRLSGGRLHATDATNASRTALYDIRKGCWDEALCEMFDVPRACLPEVRDCAGDFGHAEKSVLGTALPIRGIAGDQQAALVGQGCFAAGEMKSTYGTGAFLVLNTARQLVSSKSRLLGTIAYRLAGETTYALEGSILSAGTAIQWLRDGLGIISRAPDVEALAASVNDSGGVYLVPAFTGLGAPYWDAGARGALIGLTRASSRAEIARAALDCVVYQTYDLLEAMAADGIRPAALKIDGGMAMNGLFMQRLADVLGVPIERPRISESTAFGAACLAGLGCGMYGSLQDIARLARPDARCEPRSVPSREADIAGWRAALARVRTT
ncbi:MAG TPA: glycerol kinase GlpK [Steroidobacteraceae bacterium]|nr:glycerol kinase GlpK [Steroidobacteraceae bacterium]